MDNELNRPATKGDLQEIRVELRTELTAVRAEMTSMEARLVEAMRDIETHLLKAFHGFAEASERRLHRVETAEADSNQRLAALEKRVLDLELRSTLPPRQ